MFWSIFGQSLGFILAIVILGSIIASLLSRRSDNDHEKD